MSDSVRRLRRSTTDKMIAGVCGGLAHYFGVDPVLVRVLYVVGSIMSVAFPGILVYILLCIIIPKEDQDSPFSSGW